MAGPAGPDEETLLVADVDLDTRRRRAAPHPAQRPHRGPAARLLQCCGRPPSAACRRGHHSHCTLSATTPSTPLLADLNDAQREAVVAPDGPLLIFAGAGSGKTRVLTHRIAYVLATRDVRPHEICAVTFTNKAAREMRGRIEVLLGGSTSGMWIGTFHALGARILRRDGAAIGIPSGFSIYDEADRAAALRRAMAAEGIDDKRFPSARSATLISAAKNELLDAHAYAARHAGETYEATVARAFVAYQAEMRAADALDFDDLLVRTVAAAARVRRGPRGLPDALPPPLRRRVPGHQPRPVRAREAARREAPQPHRRRRR